MRKIIVMIVLLAVVFMALSCKTAMVNQRSNLIEATVSFIEFEAAAIVHEGNGRFLEAALAYDSAATIGNTWKKVANTDKSFQGAARNYERVGEHEQSARFYAQALMIPEAVEQNELAFP